MNVIADTFSRLGCQDDVDQPVAGKNPANIQNVTNNENKGTISYKNFHSLIDKPALAQCFLALPDK